VDLLLRGLYGEGDLAVTGKLRGFHDAFLAQGAAPFWALRKLMLEHHNDTVLE